MSTSELLKLAAKGAAGALDGTFDDGPEGFVVQLPGEEPVITLVPTNDAAGMAPLHRMAELVRRGAGRVHLVAVPLAVADDVLGGRSSHLIVRFEATWHSAAPSSHRFGLAVPLEGGEVRDITAADCAMLALAVRESTERVESTLVEAAWERILVGSKRQVSVGTEEVKAKLMSLQSRRRREIEAVFRARQMSLDDHSGQGDEAASAALLERERRAALDHADAYYDPNRLSAELRVSMALVLHPRALRRRRRIE